MNNSLAEKTFEDAESGNVTAQYILGGYYLKYGKQPDEAVKWLLKAAENDVGGPKQERERAQWELARLSEKNEDYEKAAFWAEKLASRGYAPAQLMLGNLYRYGQGVDQNYVEAAKWYG